MVISNLWLYMIAILILHIEPCLSIFPWARFRRNIIFAIATKLGLSNQDLKKMPWAFPTNISDVKYTINSIKMVPSGNHLSTRNIQGEIDAIKDRFSAIQAIQGEFEPLQGNDVHSS